MNLRPGRTISIAVALLLGTASPAHARDWFVRAGSEGDGTRERPFRDPYLALEKAEAGDSIHVAKGVYHGKLDSAHWVLALPNLSLLGGYDERFAERDPWKNATVLSWLQGNKARNEGTLLRGERDHANLVIDGFVLDGQPANTYEEGPYPDLKRDSSPKKELIVVSSPGVQVRNCLVLNGSDAGMTIVSDGCRIENNVFMNGVGHLVDVRPAAPALVGAARPTSIRGNTFLFAWATCAYGQGGADGNGVKLGDGVNSEVCDNVFMSCDNHAVFLAGKPDALVLKNNVFWMNGYSNLKFFLAGRDVAIDNSSMGDLEDVGLKGCEGNRAADPGLGPFDAEWMKRFINRSAAERGKVTQDDWNKLRQILGVPLEATGGKAASGVAMPYDWKKASELFPTKVPQGAHPKKLEVKLSAGGDAPAAFRYDPMTWEAFVAANGEDLDGKRFEVPAHLSSERSWYPYDFVNEKEHRGYEVLDFAQHSQRPPIFYVRKGTAAEKVAGSARFGGGESRSVEKYLFRGVIRFDATSKGVYKHALVVESIEPYVERSVERPRPVGRDWFVRAGASGGDGSKEKPWKDPWQALEACEPGDSIHVAEGEYHGKLKTGYWLIDVRFIALLGGYDASFTERDPWKRPTRLTYPKDSKAWTDGAYIRAESDHEGLIIDGFVLDGRDVNRYTADGDLSPADSTRHALIETFSPNLTVRNCVLVNGSSGSIQSRGGGGTIENNIIVNFHLRSLELEAAPNDRPWVVRNNTIVFNWYDRADGKGGTTAGTGVLAGQGTLELDGNIIGFDDVQGCFTSAPPKRVKVTNNVFMKDLFAHLTNGRDIVIDSATMGHLALAGFAASTGNDVTTDPDLPLDKSWMKVYLSRTMAIPGKVSEDEWNKVRDILGLPLQGTGTVAATCYCRPYDWKKAIDLVPRNPACKAGARPVKLEVRLAPGPPPPTPGPKTYVPVDWKVLQNEPGTIDKKDIEFVGHFSDAKNEAEHKHLPEVQGEKWGAVYLDGPVRHESGPMIFGYYRKDTRLERAIRKTDGTQKYKIRGVARKADDGLLYGCIIIEGFEKAD